MEMTPQQVDRAAEMVDTMDRLGDKYEDQRMAEIHIGVRGKAIEVLTRMQPRRTDGATYTVQDFIADADKIAQWAMTGDVPKRPKIKGNRKTRLA